MSKQHKPKPPVLASWLLSKCVSGKFHEEFLGDLEEIYQERLFSKGKGYASFMMWVDALYLMMGFTSFKLFSHQSNPFIMYKHYFVISTRNIFRNKLYSGINILGLAIGLCCCILIFNYVAFEYSFDSFHKHDTNIYRVLETTYRNGEIPEADATTGWAMGATFGREVPEVKRFVRIHPEYDNAVVSHPSEPEKVFEKKRCIM